MRKILLALAMTLLLGKAMSQGIYQPVTPTAYGSNNLRGVFRTALLIPSGCGVPGAMSLYSVDSSRFALYGDTCSNKLYFYNPRTRQWLLSGQTSIPWDSVSGKPSNFPTTYALSNDVKDSIQSRIALETDNDTIVPIPSDFGYAIPFDIYRNGTTYNISPSFNLQTHANITVSKTYYVNFNSGNDANDGLTWGTAFKSLHVALLRSDVDRIFVAKGIYPYANAWRNANPTRSIQIIGDLTQGVGDSVWVTSNATLTTGWTNVSNYYFARYNNASELANQVFDRAILDGFGDPTRLTLRASIAEVNSNAGSFFVSNDTVYIRTANSRVPDSLINVSASNASISNLNGYLGNAKNYYVKNIKFLRGGFYATAVGAKLYIDSCRIIGYDNFFDGLAETMIFNSRASMSAGDLMNYDPQGGVAGDIVEYNSTFSNAGTANPSCSNCQLSTAHGGVKIVRINSTYNTSTGQNIGDVDGTRSLMYGVSVNNSTFAKVGFAFGTGAAALAWLENCQSTQPIGGFDIQQMSSATIRSRLFTGSRTNDGTILAYTPNETYGTKVSEMQETVTLGNLDYLYVAKKSPVGDIDGYVSAKILASKLFENSGKLSITGADIGATTKVQKFQTGISVNDATGATSSFRPLVATDIAMQISGLPSQSGDLFRAVNSSGTQLARGTSAGNWHWGTNAGSSGGNFSAMFTGGNPDIRFGGTDAAQQTSLRIYSGTTPWDFIYQGNLNSGRLNLNRGTAQFQFNSNGTFSGWLLPRSGTTGAGTAPLKFTSSSLMSTPENGAIEFLDSTYYATKNTTRYKIPVTIQGPLVLDFGSTAAGASTDITITVTGAFVGDIITLGLPSSWTSGVVYQAFIPASNQVTVRMTNVTGSPIDPESATFKFIIFKNQ